MQNNIYYIYDIHIDISHNCATFIYTLLFFQMIILSMQNYILGRMTSANYAAVIFIVHMRNVWIFLLNLRIPLRNETIIAAAQN